MDKLCISNIRNILIWGNENDFTAEVLELKQSGNFELNFVETLSDFEVLLRTQLVHLIIIDSKHGIDDVKSLIQFFYANDYAHIPMLLVMDDQDIDHRCEYFTHGISTFYQKGQVEFFLETINRIDRELTFKEGLKEMSIAVLDDDRLQLAILKDMLSRNQILSVDFFSDPIELLNVKHTYDIYLIDLILPQVDGEIVMLEMRKRNENAVIIGISSIEKKSTIAKVLSIGANDYITKPVNEQVFLAKLYSNSRILMLLKENEIKKKILQELAIKDGLTGLYNHKHIHEILDANIKMARRYSRPLSLLMLDIDNFKHVNDTYGHPFGDIVLANVAKIIKDTVRDSDVVGRYGGEEFIVILPETCNNEALILGERIRSCVEDFHYHNGVHVTLSGGASQLIENAEQIIRDADQLLYSSKNTGKNKITHQNIIKNNSKESFLTS